MRMLEAIFLWGAVWVFLFSTLLFLSGAVFKKEKHMSLGWKAGIAAFASLTITIIVRWIESGHPPVLWSYEHALAGAWFIGMTFNVISLRYESLRPVGILISPLVMLTLGYGIMKESPDIEPLPPPYQSAWLWVHVGFAWVAYGAYHVAAGIGILYLIKDSSIKKKGEENIHRLLLKLPGLGALDELTFKLIIYGFIAHVVMLGAGALWAYGLWGRYWAWDPIEIWTLVSWLIYGLTIHLRMTYDFTGRKGAWLSILSLSGVLIFFGGIGFVGKGVHTPLL